MQMTKVLLDFFVMKNGLSLGGCARGPFLTKLDIFGSNNWVSIIVLPQFPWRFIRLKIVPFVLGLL